MGKPPAFQFYAADFKMDTDDMSAEAVGAYIRLLCSAWVKGRVPTDLGRLASIAGLSRRRFARIWPEIEGCWISDGNGGLINARQERERRRQEEWRKKSAKGGRASAKARGDQ